MIRTCHEECEEDRGALEDFWLAGLCGASTGGMQYVDTGKFLQHQEGFIGPIAQGPPAQCTDEFRPRFPVAAATSAGKPVGFPCDSNIAVM